MTDAGAFDVDLFVIGGGSGGVRAARIAAGHGARVMLAEEFRLGGTCVIRGCVPKKLYVMASRMPGLIAEAAGFGFDVAAPTFDWPKLVAAKEKEITRLEGLYHRGQESAGVTVVASRAVLEDAHMARLADGRRVRARMILIATGGRPFVPDIPGAAHAITSNDIFDLPEFPRRLVVMGGGYIAMEFACAFAGLGAEVSVVYRGQNILRGFDEDIRDHVRAACEQRGIRFFFEDIVTEINPGTGDSRLVARTAKGLSIDADQVLFATGRVANTAAMGLEEAGVRLGKNGEILVDAASRTSVPHIYAVGDVTDRVNLTPVAIREGHAFADSVFGNTPWNADYTLVPTAVFTTPEIGTVGMTEAEALAKFADINVFSAKFRPMRVTLSGGSETTFMKLIVDAKTDRILGAHLCGENAGEMIQLVGITLKMGATKAQFDATMAVHPTAAEELVTMRSPTRRFRAGVPA